MLVCSTFVSSVINFIYLKQLVLLLNLIVLVSCAIMIKIEKLTIQQIGTKLFGLVSSGFNVIPPFFFITDEEAK
jgi:hypothetical protein